MCNPADYDEPLILLMCFSSEINYVNLFQDGTYITKKGDLNGSPFFISLFYCLINVCRVVLSAAVTAKMYTPTCKSEVAIVNCFELAVIS
jgi:hypothetical protein